MTENKMQKKGTAFEMPKWGWIPDIPDARDYVYEAPLKLAVERRSPKKLPAGV